MRFQSSVFILFISIIGLTTNPQSVAQAYNLKIIFTSESGTGDRQLYSMNLDGSDIQRLTDTMSTFQDRNVDSAACSPDSKYILFSTASGIHKINADGTGLETIIKGFAEDPGWSPDGNKIVFNWIKDNKNEIYIADSDGTHIIQITENSRVDRFAAWSPDGSQIAFSAELEKSANIFTMNMDGTDEKQVTANSNKEILPDWSPDGSKLLFTAYVKPIENNESLSKHYYSDLFIVNVDGTDLQNLTNLDNQDDDHGKWSPDGKQIAFTSSRDGNPEIYIMGGDGSNITRITNNEGDDFVQCWIENLSVTDIEHMLTPVS